MPSQVESPLEVSDRFWREPHEEGFVSADSSCLLRAARAKRIWQALTWLPWWLSPSYRTRIREAPGSRERRGAGLVESTNLRSAAEIEIPCYFPASV